jgi:hypothetical protein
MAASLLALFGLCATMKTQFDQEVAAAGLPAGPGSQALVTEADVASLPEPARRYIDFMRVVGRPRDWSFRLHSNAQFKPSPDAEWRPAESWQYNSALDVARIYHMKMRFYGVPVLGRDVYLHGRGRLLVRPLDLITVEDEAGQAFDLGELVTWLDDAVLFAPSMLLGPKTTWSAASDDAFDLTFEDAGHTVTARVSVDARGAPVNVETDVRSLRAPKTHEIRRARWSTPITGWQEIGERRVPTGGRAVWHLAEGDFAYAELTIGRDDIAFNVAPGS